jgi:hypothetical protein
MIDVGGIHVLVELVLFEGAVFLIQEPLAALGSESPGVLFKLEGGIISPSKPGKRPSLVENKALLAIAIPSAGFPRSMHSFASLLSPQAAPLES